MFRLALLLLGGDALLSRWKTFLASGLLLTFAGAGVIFDIADGVTDLATGAFGAILLAEGLISLLLASAHTDSRRRFEMLRALALIVCACLVLDFPWDNSLATWLLFSAAFVFNGLLRILSGLIVRYPRWQLSCAIGVGYLALALLLANETPLPHRFNVSFCVGLGLVVCGLLIAHGAWRMRQIPAGARLASIGLSSGEPVPEIPGAESPASEKEEAEMIVHVWTAVDGAKDPLRLPVINRYIGALSRKGGVSTGHAALSCGPSLYISHHPAEAMIIGHQDFLQRVRATGENDVAGKWFPSYAEEVAADCPSSFRIRFSNCNRRYLESFWMEYRRETTYNLTKRNCSVAVARALEAALEGVFADKPFWPTLLRLVVHPDMWLAGGVRVRAGSIAWTPGLVLDYSAALRRITHPRADLRMRFLFDRIRRHRRS